MSKRAPRQAPQVRAFPRTARSVSNVARVDWLFSYHPTPGTVAYLGYGNRLMEPAAFRFRGFTVPSTLDT